MRSTKSPTMAGIASFACNILLALFLAPVFRGPGIALALSLASAANTLFLFLLMRRYPEFSFRTLLAGTAGYTLKIALFSAAAGFLLFYFRDSIRSLCAGLGGGKILQEGLPLCLCALLFGGTGAALLALGRDKLFASVLSYFRRKK